VDVGAWLRGLGLGQYEQAFRDNDIGADLLVRLTAEDLKEIGVVSVGHRRRLLDAVAALRAEPPTLATPVARPAEDAPSAATHEAERRQVAVLFADLAGYTALARELDAEEVHELLDGFFAVADRLIEEHGGTVDKHIGDCVMGVFGAPVAHGNDAERAVRAALAIRDATPALSARTSRPIAVHIGVASGQVVASGTGGPGHRTYTVTGDSVNLASRLTDSAAPGEVLVSHAVRGTMAERLECEEAGALEVKGFAEPVRAWRLLGLRAPADSAPRALVGRQGELRQFEAALAACEASGRGQALYVRGEAGIGKTRLVEEVARLAAGRGFACHVALVLDFGAGTGRDAVRSLVRSILGVAAGADAAARALGAGLVAVEDAAFLNDLLDVPQPTELRALYDAMDNAARNRGKRRTVARLVERASRERPLLLVVEDLHWADQLVLAHLARLAATAAECPALLVMTARAEGDPLDAAWRARLGGAPLTTVDLGPLRPDEAHALAGTFLRANAAFAERCVARAAGNPLFLEQLLRHAEESAEAGVPGSVQNLVQARLDRLEAADRQALQAASVLGQRFAPGALGHLLGRPDYDPTRLVRQLLVRPQGEELLFAHALIRDAVYDSLLRPRRRELHQHAAAWYRERDPVLSAEHLERAQDPTAPRAFLAAARSRAAEYHQESALRLVERGLALATERGDRFALTCYRGQVLHDLGAMTDARGAYEAALAAAGDDAERSQAWLGLAAVKRVTDDIEGAVADLDRAEAAGLLPDADLARAHLLRGNLCFPKGDIEGCLEHHGKALEIARRAGAAELEAAALGGLADAAYMRGRLRTARDRFGRCVELARSLGLGRIEVANLPMVGHCLIYTGEFDRALEVGHQALELASRVGHLRAEIVAHNLLANVGAARNEPDRCEEAARRLVQLARQIGSKRFEANALKCRAEVMRLRGRCEEAEALLGEALALARESGIHYVGPWMLAQLAATTRDPSRRVQALAECETLLAQGSIGRNHLWAYRFAIEASIGAAAWGEAERYAQALEDYARPEPLAWSDFWTRWGRGLAAYGRRPSDPNARAELLLVRGEAMRIGMGAALPALATALVSA
jgi:class 3 adenylate cyclase/tetratricopeptide (TPR) repeat protein